MIKMNEILIRVGIQWVIVMAITFIWALKQKESAEEMAMRFIFVQSLSLPLIILFNGFI